MVVHRNKCIKSAGITGRNHSSSTASKLATKNSSEAIFLNRKKLILHISRRYKDTLCPELLHPTANTRNLSQLCERRA